MTNGKKLTMIFLAGLAGLVIFIIYADYTGYQEAVIRKETNRKHKLLTESQHRIPSVIAKQITRENPMVLENITKDSRDLCTYIYVAKDGQYVLYADRSLSKRKDVFPEILKSPANFANLSYDATNGTESPGSIFVQGKVTLP